LREREHEGDAETSITHWKTKQGVRRKGGKSTRGTGEASLARESPPPMPFHP